jgi:hypothetical protein
LRRSGHEVRLLARRRVGIAAVLLGRIPQDLEHGIDIDFDVRVLAYDASGFRIRVPVRRSNTGDPGRKLVRQLKLGRESHLLIAASPRLFQPIMHIQFDPAVLRHNSCWADQLLQHRHRTGVACNTQRPDSILDRLGELLWVMIFVKRHRSAPTF